MRSSLSAVCTCNAYTLLALTGLFLLTVCSYLSRPTSYTNYVNFSPSSNQYLQASSTLALIPGTNGGLTIFASFSLNAYSANQRVFDCGQSSGVVSACASRSISVGVDPHIGCPAPRTSQYNFALTDINGAVRLFTLTPAAVLGSLCMHWLRGPGRPPIQRCAHGCPTCS